MSRALGDLQYKNPVNTVEDESTMPRERRASSSSAPVRGDFLLHGHDIVFSIMTLYHGNLRL